MSISLFNPWLLLGVTAVVVPIWLHLKRKREPNLLRFSAVRFLADQPPSKRSPMRLRDLILFLARAAVVLLVATAFALPWLHRGGSARIEKSVVYILDDTLSRQAGDGFAQDQTRLVRDLTRHGAKEQIGVIALTGSPRVIVHFGDNSQEAVEKVRQLKPSFQRGSYLSAFREAAGLLADAPGRKKSIVLLADDQVNQWEQESETPPFLRNVQLELPARPAADMPNLWLSQPGAEWHFTGELPEARFSMRLGHSGSAQSAHVVVRVDSKPVLDRVVSLVGQPEGILLQAKCQADPANWLQAEATVEGRPDALPADNHLYFSLPPIEEGKVALLAESPFLRLALSPKVIRGRWKTRVLNPLELNREISQRPLEDVLCIESGFLEKPDAWDLLQKYLGSDRGVFLIINRTSPAIDICLRRLGYESDERFADHQPKTEHFQFVLTGHPIFESFQNFDFSGLTEVTVRNYTRLRAVDGRPLILSDSGAGLFFEDNRRVGKLYVCAFGMDRENSSWPVHPSFIPFLDLTFRAARPKDVVGVNFLPGEWARLKLPEGVSARELIVRSGSGVIERAPVEQQTARLRLPSRPGQYSMSLDSSSGIYRLLSVNVPAQESELKFGLPGKGIDRWVLPASKAEVARPVRFEGVGFSSLLRQHIWWWILLGAVVALAFETAAVGIKERLRE